MSEVVHTFTTTVPRWQPYVVPVDFATATDEQHAAMQTTPSNKGISPYVLTLAHDPETLAVRSPLFNLIMYGKDGLAASERELGAVAASV
ncbi:alkylhydroperoxidase, partial [Rhizobium ruizarguesonis]